MNGVDAVNRFLQRNFYKIFILLAVVIFLGFVLVIFKTSAILLSSINVPAIELLYQPSIDSCVKGRVEVPKRRNVAGEQGAQVAGGRDPVADAESVCGQVAIRNIIRNAMLFIFALGSVLISTCKSLFDVFRNRVTRVDSTGILKTLGLSELVAILSSLLFFPLGAFVFYLLTSVPNPVVHFAYSLLISSILIVFYSVSVMIGLSVAVFRNFEVVAPIEK